MATAFGLGAGFGTDAEDALDVAFALTGAEVVDGEADAAGVEVLDATVDGEADTAGVEVLDATGVGALLLHAENKRTTEDKTVNWKEALSINLSLEIRSLF